MLRRTRLFTMKGGPLWPCEVSCKCSVMEKVQESCAQRKLTLQLSDALFREAFSCTFKLVAGTEVHFVPVTSVSALSMHTGEIPTDWGIISAKLPLHKVIVERTPFRIQLGTMSACSGAWLTSCIPPSSHGVSTGINPDILDWGAP